MEMNDPEHNRKLFIGGLDYSTTNNSLQAFFEQWGEIVDVVVMRDLITKRSRGFGFITYSRSSMADRALSNRPHNIDGRDVETKRAILRENIREPNISTPVNNIFVCGIKEQSENDLLEYFGKFGNIINMKIITDKNSGKRKGFGFIEYDDFKSVDNAVFLKSHQIAGEKIIVNKAIQRADGAGGSRGIRGDRGGGVIKRNSWEGNLQNEQFGGHYNNSIGGDGGYGGYGTSGMGGGYSYVGNVDGCVGVTVVHNSNYGGAWQGAPQTWVNNSPPWGNQKAGNWGGLQQPCYNLDLNQTYGPISPYYTSHTSALCNQRADIFDPNQTYGPIKPYYTSNNCAMPNGNPGIDYVNADQL